MAQDKSYLDFLIPHPKYLVPGLGSIKSFRLEGVEGFHEAVLPRQTRPVRDSGPLVRVRLWDELTEADRARFPAEASCLSQDPEAYAIQLAEDGGLITAADRRGLQHGLATLRQLTILAGDAGEAIPAVTIVDWPDAALRGAHLCYHRLRERLPYSAPDFGETIRSLERFAQCKLNAALMELEALFPYQKHPDISVSFAFTPDQIAEIVATCKALHIELIPKVQCLGHQYHVLTHERYRGLRETPDKIQQLCPTNPESIAFVLELVDEHRAMMPGLKYFHLGGDESRQLGDCPRCRAKIEREGISALYVDHVAAVCEGVLERGITPLIWSDMLEHHPESLEGIPKGTVIAYWNYHFSTWGREYAVPMFKAAGYPVVACHAVKSGKVVSHVAVNYEEALRGIADLTQAGLRDGVEGFIVTNWTKAIPHDLSWRGYLYAAWETWNSGRERSAFDEAFMALWYGITEQAAEAMNRVYLDLALDVPYAEDAGRRLRDRLDRFDHSGLPMSERIEHYTSPSNRPQTVADLESARTRVHQASRDLASVRDHVRRNTHEWRLLELGARTLDHKIRMGLLFDRLALWQRGETEPDAETRSALRAEIGRLQHEWAALREETRQCLAKTHHPLVALAIAEAKFEREAFEILRNYNRLLREAERPVN